MKQLTLPALPYPADALEGVISKQVMELHHDKHHLAYVNGANAALEKLEKYQKGELDINVREVLRDFSFNYNGHIMHELFWQNMRKANDNNKPNDTVAKILTSNFGSVDAFKKEFSAAAVQVEGSGWAVLGKQNDMLLIYQLEKHNLLGLNGFEPVLALDVWEHAYYLDYQNNRAAYVDKWWNAVNWDDVGNRLGGK